MNSVVKYFKEVIRRIKTEIFFFNERRRIEKYYKDMELKQK
jgi:hypothetical protein